MAVRARTSIQSLTPVEGGFEVVVVTSVNADGTALTSVDTIYLDLPVEEPAP